jgi:PKD repeat protein
LRRGGASLTGIMLVGVLLLLAGLLGAPGIGIYKLPLASTGTTGTYFDHTVIIVMENQGLADICRQNPPPCATTAAPFMAGLANNYTIAQQYTSINVPLTSGPNYVALIGGSTFTCTSGGCGGLGALSQLNLVDRLTAKGLTWKGYFENMPTASGCSGSSQGVYNNIHNPFIWFGDIYNNATRCNQILNANPAVDSNGFTCPQGANGFLADCQLLNDLNRPNAPNLAWLTPNDCNNMHGSVSCTGTIASGDAYLRSVVPGILSSAAFTTGRGALFVTFDEGNGYCPLNGGSADCLYASWSGPQAQKAKTSANPYSHYSWLSTIEKNWGLSSLQTNDAAAAPMTEYLGSPSGPGPLQIVFSINPTNPDKGAPVTFTATASGGTLPYTFTWSFGDGAIAGPLGGNPVSSSVVHTYAVSGSYTVGVSATDSGVPPSSASSSSVLTVNNPTPTLTATFTASNGAPLIGQAVTFNSTILGGIAPYTVSWNFGDGTVDVGASIIHSYTAIGTFTVTMQVSDSGNPIATSTFTRLINVIPCAGAGSCLALTAAFSWSPAIPETQLQVTFSAAANGGTAPYSFSWTFGDGTSGVGNPITHTYGTAGTYTIVLTVTDSASGQDSVINQITVQKPTGTGGSTSSLIGLWLILTIVGAALVVTPAALFARRRPRTPR